ncbi:hypothetical protein VNO80_25541 [Phaseolus coccineus]|uniref:Uncharacterized protein n=1 Tax=Phaseolus coccineus TaxID=3886 RepID=A0AAN9LV17_PHACN
MERKRKAPRRERKYESLVQVQFLVVPIFWFVKQYDIDVQDPLIVIVLGFGGEFGEEVGKGECVCGAGVGGEADGVAEFGGVGFIDGELERMFWERKQ